MVAFKLAWAIANEFAGGAKLEPKTARVYDKRDDAGIDGDNRGLSVA